MAITASGLYGLTLEKMLIDTANESLESETDIRCALVGDAYTPDFDLHDFWSDVSANEASDGNSNWTDGGVLLTGTEITTSGGVLTYDGADASVANTSITDAMAAVLYFQVGADLTTPADDMLILLSDFVTAASTTNGTFTVQWSASGIFTIDYTP